MSNQNWDPASRDAMEVLKKYQGNPQKMVDEKQKEMRDKAENSILSRIADLVDPSTGGGESSC